MKSAKEVKDVTEQLDVTNVMESIQQEPSVDDRIERFLADQKAEFPDAADIEVDYRYTNPFEIPAYLNRDDYSYAWLDPQDDIQMFNALEKGYFKIVTRSSSCIMNHKKAEPYFRSHGAIELQRMILGFRPKDLDNKIRSASVKRHADMVEGIRNPKEGESYDITYTQFQGEKDKTGGSKITSVYAYEEEGEEGLKFTQP